MAQGFKHGISIVRAKEKALRDAQGCTFNEFVIQTLKRFVMRQFRLTSYKIVERQAAKK